MNDFFRNIEVRVPNRSGEDKSFGHQLTGKCGTLIPTFWDEVIPGTKVHLKAAMAATLPPLASDTYMNVRIKNEAFFVPFRQLSAAYPYWLTGEKILDSSSNTEVDAQIPLAMIEVDDLSKVGPGSLADYLGFKFDTQGPAGTTIPINLFPFICYHWIWDNMYRNSKLQKRAFSIPAFGTTGYGNFRASFIPYMNRAFSAFSLNTQNYWNRMADSKYLYELRQRNFDADYFTNMTLNPQSVSNPAAVTFTVDAQGNGGFTIAALRAQNSLQQYLERQNLAGFRLTEYVKANYGVILSEGLAQMPLFLGRSSIDVYSKGIEATSNVVGTTQNPFAGSTGARYGNAYAIGNDTLVDEFEAKEPGIIMVLTSLVPKVTYATGIDPLLLHYGTQTSQGDCANPLLQNVGQQPVSTIELNGNLTSVGQIFGYTDRYSEFMTKVSRVSGLLRDGQSLQSFALQRSFSSNPTLGSSFIEIPTSYMDQVSAIASSISSYGYQLDCFFDYKIAHPLQKYSIPSLQDPAYEHGKGVIIDRSGQVVK